MGDRDCILEARDEDGRAHSAVEPFRQSAAEQSRKRAQERQGRQSADERDDPRQKQHLDRVETHGAESVDFLAHLHRAEFGGVGTARTARDHDGDEQHADLAQHENADQIDRVVASAEPAEMENALLGDNPADQDGDQKYDRNGLKPDAVELIDKRCRP